jgi:phosphatidylglycerophosphate synthase
MKTEFVRDLTRNFVNFISRPFIYFKVSPNFISVFSLFVIIAFFPFLKYEYYYFASLMILLNGAFDVIDGAVARATNKSSKFGKFFDRTIDKISDSLVLAGFIIFGLVSLPLGLYALITMFLATNISANVEGVLKFKISDAVSLRFLRIIVLVILTALGEFYVMFIVLAIISTYSLIHRFGYACYLYYRGKKK